MREYQVGQRSKAGDHVTSQVTTIERRRATLPASFRTSGKTKRYGRITLQREIARPPTSVMAEPKTSSVITLLVRSS